MQGSLSEFTLAQLLQFFALAERSGTITVTARGRESRLLVEGDRIIGWGLDGWDAQEVLLTSEMLPEAPLAAIKSVVPRPETPGLSFVLRNLVEPERWEAFTARQLEQDVYPLLGVEDGDFEIQVMRCPPAPLRLSIAINSVILDGSRWESEMEALAAEGYTLDTLWMRTNTLPAEGESRLSGLEWMIWATLAAPISIGETAMRLCAPDLATIGAVKRLQSLDLVQPAG